MHVHTSAALVWWERWAIHRGPGISWGRNTKPCLNQQQRPTGSLSCAECVCVCERERQPSSHQQTKGCSLALFPNIPYGDFLFWPYPPPLLPVPLFFSLPPSRSDCWRPEYICLATAALTLPSARNKCFALGVKKTEGGEGWQRAEPTVLQGGGLRALVVEWIWQTLQDDTGLDSLSLHLSTIRLRRVVCAPLSFVYLETA